jgi:hypothetical protein
LPCTPVTAPYIYRSQPSKQDFAQIRVPLSLNLTYLTVQMAILPEDGRENPTWWLHLIVNGTLRQTVDLLDAYSHAGKINVGQIIFDYSCERVGPSLRPEPRPYLAFQRPEGRRHTLDGILRGWVSIDPGS